jgi:periplasmic protein TonB
METNPKEYQTWDDLVFENRNKAYGAYALRKAYSNQVLLGFGFSVALLAILLLLPKGSKPEIFPTAELPTIKLMEVPTIERNVEPQQRALPPARRAETINTNTTPVIATEPVDNITPVTPTESGALGSTNGSETGISDTETTTTGTDIVPVATEPPVCIFAEVMPAYTGGNEALYEFISRKMRYPASARRMGIEGTVYVSFVVTGDGSIAEVTVIRGIHHDCDKEAARVISMLRGWTGGRQGGRPVSVRMVLPIKFQLR